MLQRTTKIGVLSITQDGGFDMRFKKKVVGKSPTLYYFVVAVSLVFGWLGLVILYGVVGR